MGSSSFSSSGSTPAASSSSSSSSNASSSTPGHADSTTYAPLSDPSVTNPRVPVPRVSLTGVRMGAVAARTAQDMAAARRAAAFDPSKIESVIRQGRIDNESRRKVIDTLANDDVFGDWKQKMVHWSREEQMKMSHVAMRRLLDIADRDDWDTQEVIEATLNLDLQSPLSLHWVAFVPVIMGQGSAEQIARWGNRAMNHEILGAYCQTELGHGTNVQALETTATYLPESDEFDIDCPTLTATKWWAGGSGLTCTHAIVQAQLIIHGKPYGPHLFFVPMRSVQDGSLLPGIRAGDQGAKAYGGFGGLDNGWVRFEHVKIPRDNMLAKNAQVKKGGEYVRPPHDKMSYGGMLFIRSNMVDRGGFMLSRAITIALRYSQVRRQFRDPDSSNAAEPERSVLSYPSLNRRLLPILSQAYAIIFTGRKMRFIYEDLSAQMDQGDVTQLADVHVASSSLKAYTTKQVIVGIEECRQGLGGHGFLASAGYNNVFLESLPSVTYEGDNVVLAQQVSRALIKLNNQLKADANAPVTETTAFVRALHDASAVPFRAPTSAAEWLQPQVFLAALELRAARLVADLQAEVDGGRRLVDCSYESIEIAKSHAEVITTLWFGQSVADDAPNYGAAETEWLNKLVALNALTSISRNITPLALPQAKGYTLAAYKAGDSILTAEAVQALEKATRQLVEEILPQCIALSDGFGWTDWELASSLGRRDGRVYENLLANAIGNPLNNLDQHGKSTGAYTYDVQNPGKTIVPWYSETIGALFKASQKRSSEEPIRGNGAKL